MTILYKSPDCSRCAMLAAWLEMFQLPYDSKLIDAQALTDMRLNGIFTLEAPVLQVGNFWYTTKELFTDGGLDTKKLRRIFEIPDDARGKTNNPYGDTL